MRPLHPLHFILLASFATPLSAAVLPPLSAQPSPPPILKNIRMGHTEKRTRFVFDVSGTPDYRCFTLKQPDRVVIDLPGTGRPKDLRAPSVEGTPVSAIRTGVQPDGTLRFVFDLRQATASRVFSLEPNGNYGYRIVVDIDQPVRSSVPPSTDVTSGADTPQQLAGTEHRTTSTPGAKLRPEKRTTPPATDAEQEWSGYVSLDTRLFADSPAYPGQRDQNVSIAVRPEYYREWDGGRQQLSFIPFGRLDSSDGQRTHADIRELYWRMQVSKWAVKAGIDVVFWGVTESQHLVDIVNQTDLVENIDGEEKLGQPMLNIDYLSDWGTWQAYLLPWFRERTYPGKHGRLRTDPPIDVSNPVYGSGDKEKHVDFALRWSQYIGDWDIGLGYFSGTIRDPLLIPTTTGEKSTLTPYYPQIDQVSLDMQSTSGAWLWKLETIYNWNEVEDYYAYVGGFEYTYFGIADSAWDLGWLLEYNYDQRGKRSLTVLQNDIYLGARLAANDIASRPA